MTEDHPRPPQDPPRPGSIPPGPAPSGSIPPGSIPPGPIAPGSVPPGSFPPGSFPPGSFPPGSFPPGSFPPGAGYGAQGYPYQPPPPPERSRGLMIGLLAGVGALALCLCAVLGLATTRFVGRDRPERPASAAVSPVAPTARPTSSPAATAATAAIRLAAPARIGSLRRSNDQSALVDGLLDQLRTNGMRQPFAAFYEDAKNRDRPVMIWGSTGRFGMETLVVAGFFHGVEGEVGDVVGRRKVPPGPHGGTAECGFTGGAAAIEATVCVWATDQALLAMMFNERSIDASAPWVAKIVAAVARRG
ncbi:MAG TPA: hypothetical protein VHI50_02155 [Micromonosporaceae bacterium]|nr:hypothetical protein [Micromonosporaceae bacterium]